MVTLRVGIIESRVDGRRLGGREPRRDSRREMTPESCHWGPDVSLRESVPDARLVSCREILLSPEPWRDKDSWFRKNVAGEVDGREFSEGGIQIGFDSSAQTSTIELSMAPCFDKDPAIAQFNDRKLRS